MIQTVKVPRGDNYQKARMEALRCAGFVIVGRGTEDAPWTSSDRKYLGRIKRCHVDARWYRFKVDR